MKAAQLAKRMRELTGAGSYAEAVTAVEGLVAEREPRAPVGVTLTLDLERAGLYWPALLGAFGSVEEIRALQGACRHFANVSLGELLERAIAADAARGSADKETTGK